MRLSIDIEGRHLSSLPAEIGQLESLQHLSIDSADLRAIPAEIEQLTNLEHLTIGAKNVTTLPATIRKLLRLQTLWIKESQYTNHSTSLHVFSIPAAIGELKNLEKLTISADRLKPLPVEICQLKRLHTVKIDVTELNFSVENDWCNHHPSQQTTLKANTLTAFLTQFRALSSLQNITITTEEVEHTESLLAIIKQLELQGINVKIVRAIRR